MEHNINKVKMLEFPQRGDERGHLVIVEGGIDIPFDIKRAFYIYGSDHDVVRGQHANRKTEFVLINVAGTEDIASSYAATYPIALIAIVVASQLIIKLC